jgi:hypothetical protein
MGALRNNPEAAEPGKQRCSDPERGRRGFVEVAVGKCWGIDRFGFETFLVLNGLSSNYPRGG